MAGLALVAFLTLLNLTVSEGTINGIIFYANIVQAIKTAYLPTSNSSNGFVLLLNMFISWLNLDLGIPTCFYNGMDAYGKTWLQFLFPLYILAIVSAIIITSHYSTRAVKLFGNNAVPVLATLFLLTYAKMLRILITAFSFTILTDEENSTMVVWLFDGNVKYFELKHVALFIVALLVLLVAIPYTFLLFFAPWIQKSPYMWISNFYNKCKPLFDAYMGPYKDKHRYWTGLLLLVRVVLFAIFSSNVNTNASGSASINLFIVVLVIFCLLTATTTFKPYKKNINNALESIYLLNLVFLSSSSLYISGAGLLQSQVIAYSILVGIALLVFVLVIGYHVYQKVPTRKCYRNKPPRNLPQVNANIDQVEEEENGEEFNTDNSVFKVYREPLLEINSL